MIARTLDFSCGRVCLGDLRRRYETLDPNRAARCKKEATRKEAKNLQSHRIHCALSAHVKS